MNLYAALAKAQGSGDVEQESKIMPQIARLHDPKPHRNHTNKLSKLNSFFEKICYGASECWYWRGGIDQLGYGHGIYGRAHRVSWELFNGPIPKGLFVLHKCDIRNCVNPDHLFIGTQTDNMQDMVKKGRNKCTPKSGEENHMSVLNWESVREIRAEYAKGLVSQRSLAHKYRVSYMTICRVVNHKLWRET